MNVKVSSPQKIDSHLRDIIKYLELDESKAVWMEVNKSNSFVPEPTFCHLNVMVKMGYEMGIPQFGWMLAQDKSMNFSEAQFHCVWKSPEGDLQDITPRLDNEKRVLFIPDDKRAIGLCYYENKPAINTFDNVRVLGNQYLTDLRRIKIVPETDMFEKYGIEFFWKASNK